MARLYLKIYLAVLASLALFALLAGLAWRLTADEYRFGQRPSLARAIAEEIAPPIGLAPAEQKARLERFRDASGYDLAIFGPDGQLIADASDGVFRLPGGMMGHPGMMGPGNMMGQGGPPRVSHWRTHRWAQVFPLPDGRTIVAARPRAERGEFRRFRPVFFLLGIALAVGIAFYPIVRRLTRRLEHLQTSVAALGAGDLAARVKVEGKDEIARLAQTFNGTADRVQALVTANRALLANASHELRSPLARLRMGVEGLSVGAPAPAKLDEINRNIRELDQLIDEILLASRLDGAGELAMTREAVDLVAMVAEECAVADAALDIRTPSLPIIQGDPRLLKRLVRNLVENAWRHGGGATPEVTLTVLADGQAELTVADRGPGVPEAERQRIFEPFYRVKGGSEAAGGAGLGLALVRQIAQRHGGSVMCLPRAGGGAEFRVVLPTDAGSARPGATRG